MWIFKNNETKNNILNSNSWSYPALGRSIDHANWLSGGVLYDVEAKNRYQRRHFLFMKLNTLALLFEMFYFTFLVPFDLLKFITNGIQLSLVLIILFLLPWSQENRSHVITILNWIAVFPKKEFIIKNKDIKAKLGDANKYSMVWILFATVLVSTTGLILMIGAPVFRYFVMKEDLTLPLDVHLPSLPPTNMFFYFINFIHQLYTSTFLVITCTAICIFSFCAYIQMIYFLKCLKILTENMQEGIVSVGFEKWHELIITTTIEVKRLVVE